MERSSAHSTPPDLKKCLFVLVSSTQVFWEEASSSSSCGMSKNINRHEGGNGCLWKTSFTSSVHLHQFKILISSSLESVSSELPTWSATVSGVTQPAGGSAGRLSRWQRGVMGVASVSGGRDDAYVQEVVRVAEVFAEPLKRSLQQRFDTVDHHLVTFLLTIIW